VLDDGDAASVFSRPDILHQTGLEAPQITRLAQALALGETPLTVEQFVDLVRRRLSGSA